MVSDSVLLAWFVTMKMICPAPTLSGETETRALLTYTVRLTGLAGLGLFAKWVPPPQPEAATSVTVSVANVLVRNAGLPLLFEVLRRLDASGTFERTLTDAALLWRAMRARRGSGMLLRDYVEVWLSE